ncbi:MAG: MFS transporter [Calditrichaeota bacterium]|nr:MFS transporter [Calditrichota bacterium]
MIASLKKLFSFDKTVWGWAFYDWANSAFATTVMAGFFPIFFKNFWSSGVDANVSTFYLGMGNSIAGLIIALMAPLLGAIADKGSARKKFLIFFAFLGIVMTAALFWVGQGAWQMAVLVFVLGTVGFSGANIFYDALLPLIAREEDVDLVSGLGYGLGYLGGGLLFAVNVAMTLMPETFGLESAAQAVRFAFLSVALWWAVFSLLLIFWVPEEKRPTGAEPGGLVSQGFREFKNTLSKMPRLKTLFTFLLAYWLYIDGVDTVIRMAVDYGKSLGFEDSILISALLLVQFVGFPAAIIYTRMAQQYSIRKGIFFGIFAYGILTLGGMFMTNSLHFFALAVGVGLVQGGIQALSRSYFARLIPTPETAGEFFGFYNMIGKSAVVIGPVLMGAVGLLVKAILETSGSGLLPEGEISLLATRFSLGALVILFAGGALLLARVDEANAHEEARLFRESHPGHHS